MNRYAEVLLPLPLIGTFTYSVPEDMEQLVERGQRVLVQFGKRNYYTGIIIDLHVSEPKGFEVRDIMMILDLHPVVRHPQLKFWNWIADYYLCTPGDVFKAAVPTGLKVESETYISLNSDYEYNSDFKLTERMAIIIQYLSKAKKMKLSQVEAATGFRNIGTIINRLLEEGVVHIDEKIVERYHVKKETFVALKCKRGDQDTLHSFFDKLTRSQKQERMLIAWLDISGWLKVGSELKDVSRAELYAKSQGTPAVLKSLIDKDIFNLYTKEINRFAIPVHSDVKLSTLSILQKNAFDSIVTQWRTKDIVLLRGVTGSGKTEVYSHLISGILESGNQVLYLVPEISLTTQLTDRLRAMFGEKMLVYHSKFSDGDRVEIWKRLLNSHEPILVIGVRSSVFLPFARLGLVVIDEEHESSYKQSDPAPRYNARDAAIVLASMHGAKVLLGSATPAIETYHKALNGKYGLVEMLNRYEGSVLPDVDIVDMKSERRKKTNAGIFSSKMVSEVRSAMKNGRQAIIFQNRRGYATTIVCSECGWIPKCINCDVSLVYHKGVDRLRCHYCGYSTELPKLCPACGQNGVTIYGYGTERIEEDINNVFGAYRVSRMDLDTTRNKDSYQEIIEKFSRKETDILVGTQMVSKGLDFGKVSVVGVLNADSMLNFPDFRSSERAFNMLEQVSGRAGRRLEKGQVVIQTTDPANSILSKVKNHDYEGYFKEEISERKRYNYPPFTRVINIYLKNRDRRDLDEIAVAYALELRKVFGNRIFGPEPPIVSRVATYYLQCIMMKIESNASMAKVKSILRGIYARLSSDKRMKTTTVYYDVDPI